MDDDVDGAADLLADGAYREIEPGHQHQRLQAREGISGTIGVDGADGTVVAGVHGLQAVERLAATDFADEEAIRAHSERVPEGLTEGGHPLARGNALQATNVT